MLASSIKAYDEWLYQQMVLLPVKDSYSQIQQSSKQVGMHF